MRKKQFLATIICIAFFILFSCDKKNPSSSSSGTPEVTTVEVRNITQTVAQCGGTIPSDGGSTVTARGVCWSTNQTPTVADNITTDGTGAGSFTSDITGLSANTTYYVRAYATNSSGTGYGNFMSFTTSAITVPVLTTAEVSAITSTTAQCGGTITSDGGVNVTARGVCWSTNLTPTVVDNKTNDGTEVGDFTSVITGLIDNTTYYVRAYATNSSGTGYGSTMAFTAENLTVTDIDGNIYQIVKIGNQIWMAENLKVTHYRNGEPIPNITDNSAWTCLITGAYCNYNNNNTHVATYGRLYNWYAIGDDSHNIAPENWHVPTDEEWKELEMYLGMSQSEADDTGWRGIDEGGKLKETGTAHWASPNTGATNESGFSALPGGFRKKDNGIFKYIGRLAYYWSSTARSSNSAWGRNLPYSNSNIDRDTSDKQDGFSVRLIKD